jgi:AraC-like DNA-binding protein
MDAAMMRRIPRSVEPLRLLVGYLDLIGREATLATPELRQNVAGHIHDLVGLAFGANRDTQQNGLNAVAAAQLASALEHIAQRFTEEALRVESVARSLGISPRYLQRLLESSGRSFTARVTEMRLQKAFALLMGRDGGERRISDVAMEVGFSDISHFNRLFRARFGDSPRGVRGSRDARESPQHSPAPRKSSTKPNRQ